MDVTGIFFILNGRGNLHFCPCFYIHLNAVFEPRTSRQAPDREGDQTVTIAMTVQDFGPTLNGVMWASVVIATAFVAARMYTRHYIINNIGWDDIIMVVNLVCTANL